MTLSDTIADLAKLSVNERIQIAEELWETIPATYDWPELTDAEKATLDRRAAALDADPSRALTWEQIRERIHVPR
jgi:putative addiction module component (TIGR02574 family)